MSLILTAFLALSLFDSNLPTVVDLQTKPKSEIVKMYSNVCLGFLSGPLSEVDLVPMIQKTLMSSDVFLKKQVSEKIKIEKSQELFTKICRKDPDPHALDEYDDDIKLAVQKFVELKRDLPNVGDLKNLKLPESTELRAADGQVISEIAEKRGRRRWVSIGELPAYVPKAIVAVEDRRFFEHKGVDPVGILRAVVKNSVTIGRPEGASTITQQVARNLYLNGTLSFERKIREILLASEIEARLSKQEILELYINLIYFGRNSWGISKASEAYFNKPPSKLTEVETAFLAGLIQGPNLYQTKGKRTLERMNFVLNKMAEEKVIAPSNDFSGLIENFSFLKEGRSIQANYFRDYLLDELKSRGAKDLLTSQRQLQTTLHSDFQKTAELSLQTGLINYEKASRRYIWRGPIGNISSRLAKDIEEYHKIKELRDLENAQMKESLFNAISGHTETDAKPEKEFPVWLSSLTRVFTGIVRPVSTWQVSVVLENLTTVGLLDGSIGRISRESLTWAKSLKYGDLVYVDGAARGEYEIKQVPKINGAVVAMDAETGEILAMVGGFSYGLSSWNRAVRALRQPGSLIKPWTYMSALQLGYQPNTLLSNEPITFPPSAPGGKVWVPRNYEDIASGPRSMRWALEQSYNVMTAYLMSKTGLGPIQLLAHEFGLYESPRNNYPFILGSQETTLLSVVRAYGAIANSGYLVTPHSAILTPGETSLRQKIQSVDEITLFQIRYLLQGVTERGTARSLAGLSPYVGGKTGTTENMKDAWFVGFTPHVVIGVYVGYDKPQSLGSGFAGARVALPIVDKILRASFKFYKKPQDFPPRPPGVVFYPTDFETGEIQSAMSKRTVLEAYRESRLQNQK